MSAEYEVTPRNLEAILDQGTPLDGCLQPAPLVGTATAALRQHASLGRFLMKFKVMWTIALVIISVVTVIGASRAEGNPANAGAGLANPAAVYCSERGGDYLLASGQCRLADGRTVDAWRYFREQHARSAGLPNPAAVFCEERGSYDLKSGNCTLNHGRVLNAWDYFHSQRGE